MGISEGVEGKGRTKKKKTSEETRTQKREKSNGQDGQKNLHKRLNGKDGRAPPGNPITYTYGVRELKLSTRHKE